MSDVDNAAMNWAVFLSPLRSRLAMRASVVSPLRLQLLVAALTGLAAFPQAARALSFECELEPAALEEERDVIALAAQGAGHSDEAAECVQDLLEAHELMLRPLTSTSAHPWPTAGARTVEGALLQARLSTPWLSGHVDAVLSPQTGGRLEARGMGLQLRLPERKGEMMVGRYVSGGAGLRPDLPLIGVRYSSRSPATPAPQARMPRPAAQGRGLAAAAPPAALYHRIALSAGTSSTALGTLEVKVRELRGKADEPVAGNGLQLLPRGASEVSLEGGTLARDATTFESTGIAAATLTVRHGWWAQQTLSARAAHVGDSLLLAGLSEFRLLGLASAGATLRERGQGAEPGWLLTHDYQAFGFTSRLRFEGSGGSAKTGGDGLLGLTNRRNTEWSMSWALNPARAISVSARELVQSDGGHAEVFSLSGKLRAANGSQLSMGLKRSADRTDLTQFTIDWRIPLENRGSLPRGSRPWRNSTSIWR